MQVKLSDILGGKRGIEKVLNSDLPIKTSYRLSKLIDQLNKEYTKISEAQRKIMKKYGSEDENGVIKVDPKKQVEYQKEFEEFLSEKTKIDFDPISLDDLGDVKLSPMEIKSTAIFFKE